jgi:raffinose/stachyose/melibiose transport system permease protein
MHLDNFIQPWIGQTQTALLALCAADIWKFIGFYALIFYSALIDIPMDLLEAARLDGANGIKLVRYILLPSIKSIIVICLVLALTGSLNIFDSVLALTGGGPGTSTKTTALYMYDTAFKYGGYGYGSAIAIFMVTQCLVCTVLINKLFAKDNTL